MTFYPLEKLHLLREGYRRAFYVAGRDLLLIEESGQRYLLENRCPHAGNRLQDAKLHQGNLTCPQHGICFSLQSGRPVNVKNVDTAMSLTFYKLIYQDTTIGVNL